MIVLREPKNFKVENEIYSIVPMFYFSLFMQGAILLIINQVGAILI